MFGHSGRVSSLSWNNNVISSGSKDTTIINHDVRVENHIINRLVGHS
jgi:WD40 repeat protein